jgi:hypothetical protein
MTRERIVTLLSAAAIFAAGALAYATIGSGTAQNGQNPVRLNPPAVKPLPSLITPSSMSQVQLTSRRWSSAWSRRW